MYISLFDIVGPIMIGPSSSHTAGAARIGHEAFTRLKNMPEKVEITLFNSFADTGIGHGTDKAILAGCMGISCHDEKLKHAYEIAKQNNIEVIINNDHDASLHPNTAKIRLTYKNNSISLTGISLGGGRIAIEGVEKSLNDEYKDEKHIDKIKSGDPFYSFSNFINKCDNEPDHLINLLIEREQNISQKTPPQIFEEMQEVWEVMKEGIEDNITKNEKMYQGLCGGDAFRLKNNNNSELLSPLSVDAMAYAIAIGERNVNMGRIVAVPTAGSAGIIPGCLYSLHKHQKITEEKIIKALFIAGAIGIVIANRSTLAGSEAGCQAECGAAAAMAAGAIVYLYGGSIDHIDNAASLALGNSLGLVCDPISGLVAVPCIHRNAVYANLALSAATMALTSIDFVIYFDEVADTMFKIGKRIPCQLKETSKGGLAVTKTGKRFRKLLSDLEKYKS